MSRRGKARSYGEVPIDNSRLRGRHSPFVFGRKGWLFSDTIHVAVASAKLHFPVETAKDNGVEVHNYLSRLFERVPHLRLIGFSRCKSKPACRMR